MFASWHVVVVVVVVGWLLLLTSGQEEGRGSLFFVHFCHRAAAVEAAIGEFLLVRRFQNLETAHQGLVHRHHGTWKVQKLALILKSRLILLNFCPERTLLVDNGIKWDYTLHSALFSEKLQLSSFTLQIWIHHLKQNDKMTKQVHKYGSQMFEGWTHRRCQTRHSSWELRRVWPAGASQRTRNHPPPPASCS